MLTSRSYFNYVSDIYRDPYGDIVMGPIDENLLEVPVAMLFRRVSGIVESM